MSASQPGECQHLDATADRQVVFCHQCNFERYLDKPEQGLECPRCHSEITEVIDPSEDPRDLSRPVPDYPSSASTSPERHAPYRDGNSNPEEADIEEHHGPHGFHYRRTTSSNSTNHQLRPHHRHHHGHYSRQNAPTDAVLQRFADMLQGFGHPRSGGPMNFGGNEHTVQRTTFTSRTMGGTASVTIFAGPAPGFGHSPSDQNTPFQTFLYSTMRDMGAPPGAPGEGNNERGPPDRFVRSLQDILNLFSPENATAGDAVYSQEALDRIITNLMEQNPQSNAAPPASEQALQSLERKKVTTDMFGEDGKVECAICIDNFEEGQTATFLPCKHWFHDECVVLWLKEHNTCPVCRTPIENRGQRNANQDASGSGSGSGSGSPSSSEGQSGPNSSRDHPDPSDPSDPYPNPPDPPSSALRGFTTYTELAPGHGARRNLPDAHFMLYRFGPGNPPERPALVSRPPSQSQTPLNQVMRDISSSQREQQRTRGREAAAEQGYDTSRFQRRRTSLSPTAPRAYITAELGARMRQRSPSSSERRRTPPDREDSGDRDSSGGPLGWLRRLGGSQRERRGS